jgi:hypothetical protein
MQSYQADAELVAFNSVPLGVEGGPDIGRLGAVSGASQRLRSLSARVFH